jgi:hypothetical protein
MQNGGSWTIVLMKIVTTNKVELQMMVTLHDFAFSYNKYADSFVRPAKLLRNTLANYHRR